MARNGSGTYNLPAGNPVVTGTTISSTTTNNTFSDIATALTGSISKDGQTTPTGNLPMGGFAHTGVADATVRTQYGTAGQIQDSAFTFLTSPAGTNAITATASLGMSAYVTGQRFFFVAAASNTGACTLNINSIGVKSVTKNGTTALVAGDIAINAVTQVVYDGTQFQLLNPASATVSSFSAGSTGLTPSTTTTGAVTLAGTLAVANGGTGLATLTANNVILGNGTSAPSFVAPSTSGSVLTSNGTTWTSNVTPAFGAYQNTQQTGISMGVFTKILFETEEFDTNSNFASSRFTPTVAGYYQINAAVYMVNNCQLAVSIYKNGSEFKRGVYPSSTTLLMSNVSSLVYLNGSTDYIEIYAYSGGTSNSCSPSQSTTYFNGCLARAA